MKPWTRDAILGVVLIVALAVTVLMVMSSAAFFIFLGGMACGYGLRESSQRKAANQRTRLRKRETAR